jgi:hypothetical protein
MDVHADERSQGPFSYPASPHRLLGLRLRAGKAEHVVNSSIPNMKWEMIPGEQEGNPGFSLGVGR